MKKILLFALAGLAFVSAAQFGATETPNTYATDTTAIQWMSMEEALAAHAQNPKKIFVDVYTDWCKWCKVMDQQTFSQAEVIEYINQNFYAVKFDAEQKDDIVFKGQTFSYTPAGRRGIHLLAYAMLDQQASYPAFVVLDEELNRLGILKGFQKPEVFLKRLGNTVEAR